MSAQTTGRKTARDTAPVETYELIVIGTSWGGLDALTRLLAGLHDEVHQPIVIVQHRSPDAYGPLLGELLQSHTRRVVGDPDDKTPLERDHVYLGPPDYHMLVEKGYLALSTDEPVRHARPSVDVLFESAAEAYGPRVVGIVLTGASDDGAAGLARIKARGGVAIIQDPATATKRAMPDAALAAASADAVLPLDEIPAFLYGLCGEVGG
jgi:two-component system, chemotaxis family, protein-glutamate methylesterase/glutaminase